MRWLFERFIQTSQKLYVPGSNVAMDEMMVRFAGRSKHTFRMRSKPIGVGYQIMALCDSLTGFTYAAFPRGRDKKVPGQEPRPGEVPRYHNFHNEANYTYHLAMQLPKEVNKFTVYMDNLFTSPDLFHQLRANGIGGVGTVRDGRRGWPPELRPSGAMFEYNLLKGKVTLEDVMCYVWTDAGAVKMMSTVHDPSDRVPRMRRQPRETSTNATRVRRVLQTARQRVEIPKVIDDYNHFMGGVDLADQLRATYSLQLRVSRVWMPLFFWVLEATLVNSYVLYYVAGGFDFEGHGASASRKKPNRRSFLEAIARGLMGHEDAQRRGNRRASAAPEAEKPAKRIRFSATSELPLERFVGGKHTPQALGKQQRCILCRFRAARDPENAGKVGTTTTMCSTCTVPLCLTAKRNCFVEYHEK